MGTSEVQALSATTESCPRLADTGDPVLAGSVRSLVSSVWTRTECWEPYESRGSRTVLGARGGEIPPRDSLALVPPGGDLRPARHRPGPLAPVRLGGTGLLVARAAVAPLAPARHGLDQDLRRRHHAAGARPRPRPDQDRPLVGLRGRRPALGREQGCSVLGVGRS